MKSISIKLKLGVRLKRIVATIMSLIFCISLLGTNTVSAEVPENDPINYSKLDWKPVYSEYWNSSDSVLYNVRTTRENSSVTNLKNFVSSSIMFTKEDIPVGSVIIIDQGYQYRPDAWDVNLSRNLNRPSNVTTNRVVVDEAWWGSYTYRAFNLSSVVAKTDISNDLTVSSHLNIYVPNKVASLPVANNGALVTDEDSVYSGKLIATDTDLTKTLTYSVVSNPTHGTVSTDAYGAFQYTPDANYNGSDSFTFKAYDGTVYSNIATIEITVSAVNDIPVVSDTSVSIATDTETIGTLNGTDADAGTTLNYSVVTSPTNGAVTVNANGTFKYTPNALYSGSDSFTFKANDGIADSNIATVSISVIEQARVLKVLAIGNSFSQDATTYLYQLAQDCGATQIIVGNMYIGGCSLATHWSNAQNNATAYEYQKNTTGTWTKRSNTTLLTGITDENWDIITLQQASGNSGEGSTYNSDIQNLVNYIKSHKTNPSAKIVWHMTWAYQSNSTHTDFSRYNNDQMTMYNSITSCVQQYITPSGLFDFIIPSGTAVQNMRTSYVGDTLTRDGYHMSYNLGRYLTGMTWLSAITNWSIDDITYNPSKSEIPSDYLPIIREAVKNAISTPFSITPSSYTVAPAPPESDPNNYTKLDWKPTPNTFWNSDSVLYNVRTTSTNSPSSTNLKYFISSANMFTKEDIPVGSIIVIDEGFQYRPDAWDASLSRNFNRPSNVTTNRVVVDDEWWGSYTYRAFNLSSVVAKTDISNDLTVSSHLNIYVPNKVASPIVANNGTLVTDEDSPYSGRLIATDADQTKTLTYSVVANPTHGTVTTDVYGAFQYTPDANYNGSDSFTFKAYDGTVYSNIATIDITVSAINDIPVVSDASVSTATDTEMIGTLNGTDADAGTILNYSVVTSPTNGAVTVNTNGTFKYTPNALYSGSDSFTFKANDGIADSNIATISILVKARVSTAPTAPTGLVASNVTQTSAMLTWMTSTDSVAVTGYDIYMNDVKIGSTVTAVTYQITGLSTGTVYKFMVKAKNAAGAISAASNEVSVTTARKISSGGGEEAPTVSTPTPAPAPVQPIAPEIRSAENSVTSTTITKAISDANGTATATATTRQVTEAVSKAIAEAAIKGAGTDSIVEIKVNAVADAKSVETSIPSEAVTAATDSKIDAMTITTPIAAITFDVNALATISKETTEDVKIVATIVDSSTLSEETKQTVGDRPVFNFSVTSGDKTVSEFGGNVAVSVPYTLKAGEDKNAIVIYYINKAGKAEIVSNCAYDSKTGKITFITSHFSQYTVGYNKVTFSDVEASAWYADAVGFVAARSITTGTSGNTYSPEDLLTRGQFLVMVMKAYGVKPDENAKDNFVDAGNTFYTGYLAAAKRLKISEGMGNNKYEPDNSITRQEMFTLLYNTLKLLGQLPTGNKGKALTEFEDASSIQAWAKTAITMFVKAGIITGSDNKLTPADTTNRAQMAQILYNLLSK